MYRAGSCTIMANRQNRLSDTLKSLWPAALIVVLVVLTFVLLYGKFHLESLFISFFNLL